MSRPRPVPPPDGLDDQAALLWRATQRALRDQGTWKDSDGEALGRYCRAAQTARVMRDAAAGDPWVSGSTGQLVPHPGWKLAAEAERDAASYARDLLLTPAARKRADLPHANGHRSSVLTFS